MEQFEQLLRVYQRREQLKRRIAERKVALLTNEKQQLQQRLQQQQQPALVDGLPTLATPASASTSATPVADGISSTTTTTTPVTNATKDIRLSPPASPPPGSAMPSSLTPLTAATSSTSTTSNNSNSESEEVLLEKIRTLQNLLFEANNKIHRDAVLVTRFVWSIGCQKSRDEEKLVSPINPSTSRNHTGCSKAES